MEYCNQGNVAQLIERHDDLKRNISMETVKHIAADVANGLAFIHDKGLVHNDLKPDNIFWLVSVKPIKIFYLLIQSRRRCGLC